MQVYGGFWIRVLAYIIDAIILQFAASILIMVGMSVGLAIAGANESVAVGAVILFYVLTFVLNWLYFAILESSKWQGTPGKLGLKLIVADEHGNRISFGRATGRYFAKIISSMILLIGFFMVGWTARKQGLHDMIAGTLVYRANSPELAHNSAKVFE